MTTTLLVPSGSLSSLNPGEYLICQKTISPEWGQNDLTVKLTFRGRFLRLEGNAEDQVVVAERISRVGGGYQFAECRLFVSDNDSVSREVVEV